MKSLSLLKYSAAISAALFLSVLSSAQVGTLLFEEEFDNLNNWIIDTGNGNWGWGNGELQFYKEENVSIAEIPGEPGNNGVRIVAMSESGAGIVDQWGNPLSYTSGKINSLSGISVQHGMIETRVRVPDLDLGGWPAFWMLGTSNLSWPSKGEIDLMEMGAKQAFRDLHDTHNGGNGLNNSTVNEMTGANAIYFSESAVNGGNPDGVVSIAHDPNDLFNRPYYNHSSPLNDRFLIHRVYWDDSSIRFTVEDDGIEYDLYADDFELGTGTEAFQDPFYLIANLAIGGAYTDAYNLGDVNSGAPISFNMPAEMYVDYIRVYEWNGQGEVHLGPPNQKTGIFGIYTDETIVDDEHLIDEDAFVFVWEGTLNEGSAQPLEGDNVLSWSSNGLGWFGAGVLSEHPINLSQFSQGNLKFSIEIPANVSFQIGVTDAWGNQNYVDFPAGQMMYGLERNGEWGQASIPISELQGPYIDLRMMAYTFVILEVNGAATEFALDDIYWEGGVSNSIEEFQDESLNLSIYPQPSEGLTHVGYYLSSAEEVSLSIFDLYGKQVDEISLGIQNAGTHTLTWRGDQHSSGVYLLRLSAGEHITTRRLVINKNNK